MNIVVAVSGGIDSVVLLDMLMTGQLTIPQAPEKLVVAHFDHGIREDSAEDERFVCGLVERYGCAYETRREELGAGVSEDVARQRRYAFLHEVAKKHEAELVTAHHLDDLVETIALNIQRGTRWRGLACMSDERIQRPLLNRTKSELRQYAKERRLEWVEDETNEQDAYSRNRIRRRLTSLPSATKRQLHELWQKQLELKGIIKREMGERDFPLHSRYFVTMLDERVAIELLYAYVLETMGVSLLSEQAQRMLLAIRSGRARTTWQIGQGVDVVLTGQEWHAKPAQK